MKRTGFTLIELLITIAVLSILSGVLVAVINPAVILNKGRDARRMDDLDNVNKAMILALSDEEITLIDVDAPGGGQAVDGSTGWVRFTVPSGQTGLVNFLATLPLDPVNLNTSIYTFASVDGVGLGEGQTGFELNAILQSPDNTAKMTTDGGDSATKYEVGTRLDLMH